MVDCSLFSLSKWKKDDSGIILHDSIDVFIQSLSTLLWRHKVKINMIVKRIQERRESFQDHINPHVDTKQYEKESDQIKKKKLFYFLFYIWKEKHQSQNQLCIKSASNSLWQMPQHIQPR